MVTVTVYDLLGRAVATVDNGFKLAGAHEVKWDARAFTPGFYLYSVISADGTRQSGRMVVFRQ